MFRLDDGPLTVTSRIDRHMRRGSVPADIANHQSNYYFYSRLIIIYSTQFYREMYFFF